MYLVSSYAQSVKYVMLDLKINNGHSLNSCTYIEIMHIKTMFFIFILLIEGKKTQKSVCVYRQWMFTFFFCSFLQIRLFVFKIKSNKCLISACIRVDRIFVYVGVSYKTCNLAKCGLSNHFLITFKLLYSNNPNVNLRT